MNANETEFLHSTLSDKDNKNCHKSIIKFNTSHPIPPMHTPSTILTVKHNQILPLNLEITDVENIPWDANAGDDSMVKPIIEEEDLHSETLSPTPGDGFMSENKKSYISIIKKSKVKMVNPRSKTLVQNDTDLHQRIRLNPGDSPFRSSSANDLTYNSSMKQSGVNTPKTPRYVNNISNINVTFNTVAGPD
jgi:hypothetical protein